MADSLSIACHLTRNNFTLAVEQTLSINSITAIFGPSGSGKSTLLNIIAGLIKAPAAISFNQESWQTDEHFVVTEKRNVSLVFQDNRLFPHLTAKENLQYALKRNQRKKLRLNTIAKLANIEHLLDQYPEQLSGGEQQRVAIARAVLNEPNLLLLDEPFSALDTSTKIKLIGLIKEIQETLNIPILYVSHSLDDIQQLADQLLVIKDGKINDYGKTSEIIHRLNYGDLIIAQTALNLPIKYIDDQYGLIALALKEQEILLNKPEHIQKATKTEKQLACFIYANDISLCKEKPANSSIVNTLAGEINAIDIIHQQALISVCCDEQTFFALVSLYSLEKLSLKTTQHIYIQFKASSVRTLNL